MTPDAVPSYLEHLVAALEKAPDGETRAAVVNLIAAAPALVAEDFVLKIMALSWIYDGPSLRPVTATDQIIIDSMIRAVQPGAPLGR